MKLIRFITLAAWLGSGVLSARAELVNAIRAIVDDSVITHGDIESRTEQTVDVLIREAAGQAEVFNRKLAELRGKNLQELLDRQLVLHEFKTAGYALPESVLDELVNERIKSRYGDRMTLTKTLQVQGKTYEKFRQEVREQFIIEVLRQKNISAELIISPHKIETYYAAHREEFKLEDEVKLRIIVLNKPADTNAPSVRKLAEEIRSRIKDPATFGDMAEIHSEGSQRKERGDWGWVERSVLRKELAEAAFKLKPGVCSEVIETDDSCYLMLVEDVRLAHCKPLNDVREQIEKNLQIEERARLEKQWIEKLRKKTFVKYY
jgi:peptidyl-prolyl cis-trans isomerase SurA